MDEALQAVKATIFKIPQQPMEVLQPEWAVHLVAHWSVIMYKWRRMMMTPEILIFQKPNVVARFKDH